MEIVLARATLKVNPGPRQFPLQIEIVELIGELEVARVILRYRARIGIRVEDVLLLIAPL